MVVLDATKLQNLWNGRGRRFFTDSGSTFSDRVPKYGMTLTAACRRPACHSMSIMSWLRDLSQKEFLLTFLPLKQVGPSRNRRLSSF